MHSRVSDENLQTRARVAFGRLSKFCCTFIFNSLIIGVFKRIHLVNISNKHTGFQIYANLFNKINNSVMKEW